MRTTNQDLLKKLAPCLPTFTLSFGWYHKYDISRFPCLSTMMDSAPQHNPENALLTKVHSSSSGLSLERPCSMLQVHKFHPKESLQWKWIKWHIASLLCWRWELLPQQSRKLLRWVWHHLVNFNHSYLMSRLSGLFFKVWRKSLESPESLSKEKARPLRSWPCDEASWWPHLNLLAPTLVASKQSYATKATQQPSQFAKAESNA